MITSIEMANTLKEYAKDPNCFADLWISDKSFAHWSAEEKTAFIEAANIIKLYFHVANKNNCPVS